MFHKYDEISDIIVNMAKAKMAMNSHKGNIEDLEVKILVKLAEQEIKELEEAMGSSNYMHVIEEAADVLNFLIAASYNALRDYRRRK